MASTSSEKKPKLGLIAIEADFSGYATKKDIIIAAAISTCRNGCNDASQIDTMSVRLDLNKTHKKSWRKIWKKKKWDLKYFDDNWQERLEALDEIDDDSTATVEYTRRTFAMKFNEMLRECEERYQKTIILFTEPSTPTVINFMLRRYNFPVLASNRDGSDRETFGLDVDSAIVGVLGLKTKLHKDVSYDKAFNACIKPHLLCGKEDSWLPSANTKYTIVKYLAACKYAKKINKPEKRSRPTLHIDFSDGKSKNKKQRK